MNKEHEYQKKAAQTAELAEWATSFAEKLRLLNLAEACLDGEERIVEVAADPESKPFMLSIAESYDRLAQAFGSRISSSSAKLGGDQQAA